MGLSLTAPLTWVSGSVVYAQDFSDAWAVFRVGTENYDTQPEEQREGIQRAFAQCLAKLGRDGQLVSFGRVDDARDYFAERRGRPVRLPAAVGGADDALRAELEREVGELRDRYIDDQELAVLEGVATAAPPMVFAAVSLRKRETNRAKDRAQLGAVRRWWDSWKDTSRLINDGQLPLETREDDQREALRIFGTLQQDMPTAEPATTAQLQWWVRHLWSRGYGDPVVDELDEPQAVIFDRNGRAVLEPLEMDLLSWTGLITAGPRRPDWLLITDGEGRRAVQQTFYATGVHCTADMAERSLALVLRGRMLLDWPVDFGISWEFKSNAASLKSLTGKEKRVVNDAIAEHESEAGASERALSAPEAAADLRARLEIGDEPTLHAAISVTIAVPVAGDDDAAEREAVRVLRDRGRETRRVLEEHCDTRFQVPPGQQLDAFYQQLPGQRPRIPGYRRLLMPDQIAAQAWLAGEHIGSDRGWAFGTTVSHQPHLVRIDPRDGSANNRSTGILMIGDLGSGKTVAGSKIMTEAALDGGYVIDVDPKGDHRWFTIFPPAMVQRVMLDARDPAQHGVLDPWLCAPEEVRATAALSFLLGLLPGAGEKTRNRIAEAVGVVAERGEAGERVTNTDVLDALEAMRDPDATEAARGLRSRARFGLERLGFATAQTALDLGSRPITVIVTKSLMERANRRRSRSEFTAAENVAEQITTLIGYLAYRLMSRQRAAVKVYNNDEGHRDLSTEAGRTTFDLMQRMGRSELVIPMIGSQLATDIGIDSSNEISNLFGLRLLFGQSDAMQAARALELAGIDQDPQIIKRLIDRPAKRGAGARRAAAMPSGRLLMQDYGGRTAWVDTLVADVLAEATFTTPNTDDAALEALLPA